MIAFGKPFVDILIEAELTLDQYFILYCHVYEKLELLNNYLLVNTTEINSIVMNKNSDYSNLRKKGFLVHFEGNWMPTDKGEVFIKDLVDSYSNQKADNPLLGEENLVDLSESVYRKEFKKFLEAYPVKVTRKSGREDYLREGTKEIKELYIKIIHSKRASPKGLQLAVEYYVDRYTKNGNLAYLKNLKNWLMQEIWKDVLNYVKTNKSKKGISYGGKID